MNTRRIFIKFAIFLVAVLALSILIAFGEARTSATIDYYMTSGIATVNGVTGYGLNLTQTSSAVLVNGSSFGVLSAQWGIRAWHVNSLNATTELTNGTQAAVVNRLLGSNGTGIQSATWTPTETNLAIGFDSLKIIVYYRIITNPWTAAATFTTARLLEATLLNETVTFYYWTNRTETAAYTYVQFRFGSSTYDTQMEDTAFAEPYPPENQMVELQNQDFFGFIMYPMAYALGGGISISIGMSLSYGVLLLIPSVSLIKRYNSFVPVLILFILFGGSAGVFTLMIPEVGLSIGWIFMVIGLGGLLYKWTR